MFVKLSNGQLSKFPYTLGDLRRDNPNVSFPKVIDDATLSSYEVYPVQQTPPPAYDSKTHRVSQSVQFENSAWTQIWSIQALDKDTASANVRGKRNSLLADSDWTQLPDAPIDRAVWATYRQDLRNLSTQPGFPWEIQWPSLPA